VYPRKWAKLVLSEVEGREPSPAVGGKGHERDRMRIEGVIWHRDVMPTFGSLDELVKFFETHDLGEYWDQMPDAHFDIEIKRRMHIFSLDEDLAERLTAIARAKRMPSKTLINEWLREKVVEQAKATP